MNKEILSIIESLSNEKSLDKDIIFNILENALEISIKKKINKDINIKVIFNKNSGEFLIFKLLKIVNNVINKDKEISLNDSIIKFKNSNLNEYVEEKINEFEFNRISSKIAKQIIFNKIKEIKKNYLIEHFKKLIGKIFIGTIKKIFKNKIILDIGYDFEAILNKNNMLFNDKYILEKKIKIILYNVIHNIYGLQLLVSRSHIAMLYELIRINIYEIDKKIFKIKYFARDPGIRTKIIIDTYKKINLHNLYKNIYIKINKISNELNGERIDFILWNNNIIKFVENLIFPIKAKSIKLNNNIINLLINKNDLLTIFGKNNHNIKLISKLINQSINITSI